MDIPQKALKRVALLSQNAILNKIKLGASYGATAYIYGPATVADLELSSSQCLLLGLVHALVTEEIMSCCTLAEVCFQFKELQSDHLRVWLAGDFVFPRQDMVRAMVLFGKLLANDILKMPPHVIRILSSLATKYGVHGLNLPAHSTETRDNLAIQLENSVINNCPSDIITLASEGGDVNGLTQSGDSLLHLAARADSYAAITALGYLKADLEAVNSNNMTPLEEAVRKNNVHSIKELLMAGANINRRMFRGDTYLHIAATGGQNESLEILLQAGIEKNKINYYGETPLVCAVRAGNTRGVELLLEKGADPGIIPEGSYFTLLDMIMDVINVDELKEFVQGGTILNLKSKDDNTILHLVARSGKSEMLKVFTAHKHLADVKNQNGTTPLHVASDISVVRTLIKIGVDLNSQDKNGCTALMIASKNSKADIVKLLLYSGANPKIKDKNGQMAIHHAAEGGCIECVTILLDSGEKVDEKDDVGKTPSFFAAVNNKANVIELLAERGADFTNKVIEEHRIIHHAIRSGHVEAVKALLDAGVDVEMKGQWGMTPLCYAAEKGHVPLSKLLLDRGANIDGETNYGSTAIMWASQEGHLEVVELLFDHGALINKASTGGRTALKYALDKGHKNVAEFLRSKGGVV